MQHVPEKLKAGLRRRRKIRIAAALPLALLASASLAAGADAAAVPLGTSSSAAVLAGSTATNTGPTVISGDLGVSPGTAVVGFPPGLVSAGTIHAADAVALQAKSDLTIAYGDAAARSSTSSISADLAGRTLTPGVYTSASSIGLSGDLTLDGQGDPSSVFVFQAGSTLTAALRQPRPVHRRRAGVQRLLAGRQLGEHRLGQRVRRQHPRADVDHAEDRRHAVRPGAGPQRRGHDGHEHDHPRGLHDAERDTAVGDQHLVEHRRGPARHGRAERR